MKRILALITLLICTALLLVSCADADLAVTVTESGGTINYEYYVDKEIADEYFNAELPDGIKACQIDEIDGRICYVFSESFTAQSFAELESKLCNIKLYGEDGMNVFSKATVTDRNFTFSINPCVTEDIKSIALTQGASIDKLARLSLKITMPYEIEQYSEGVLSEDKKTLTLEISSFEVEKKVNIKCVAESIPTQETEEEKEPSGLPLIIGGILLILTVIGAIAALVVFLVTRRKRKRAEAMPETPIDKI